MASCSSKIALRSSGSISSALMLFSSRPNCAATSVNAVMLGTKCAKCASELNDAVKGSSFTHSW
eukprot:110421-Amphidinium_carterae.1